MLLVVGSVVVVGLDEGCMLGRLGRVFRCVCVVVFFGFSLIVFW